MIIIIFIKTLVQKLNIKSKLYLYFLYLQECLSSHIIYLYLIKNQYTIDSVNNNCTDYNLQIIQNLINFF